MSLPVFKDQKERKSLLRFKKSQKSAERISKMESTSFLTNLDRRLMSSKKKKRVTKPTMLHRELLHQEMPKMLKRKLNQHQSK
jgi:hypothetical protein